MKKALRRHCAFVVFASAMLVWSASAQADGDDPTTLQARALYRDGISAYTEKHYEEARAAFLKVHELKPLEIEVLRDLGAAEVRTENWVDGAQHLSDWLRHSTKGSEKERKAVQDLLDEAKKTVGMIQIRVIGPDAEIVLDDHPIGRSPIKDEIYAFQGQHIVRAERGLEVDEKAVPVDPGVTSVISLSPRAPTVATTIGRRPPRAGDESARASEKLPEQPLALREQHAGLLFFGGGIALASAGFGTIFLRSASRADQDANQLDRIAPCTQDCDGPGYAHDARGEAQTNRTYAALSFSAAGVAALGTAAYFLWVPEEPRQSRSAVPLVFGSLVAVVGLTTGIIGTIDANSDRNSRTAMIDTLHQLGLGDHGCLPGSNAIDQCSALLKSNRDYDEHREAAIGGFALTGAFALGATTYLLWPDSRSSPPVNATVSFEGRNRELVIFGQF